MNEQELRLECLKLAIMRADGTAHYAHVLARAGQYVDFVKAARPTQDGTRPGADRAEPQTPSPVSEGSDSDRHPWVGPTGNVTPEAAVIFDEFVKWDTRIAAELNRLHLAARDATAKERDRCLREFFKAEGETREFGWHRALENLEARIKAGANS